MTTCEGIERLNLYTSNRPVDVIRHWRNEGDLNLSPEYQRGEVWGPVRQRNLIKSILSGVPIPSIIVNIRDWDGDYTVAVIDGKQRITAVLAFVDSELLVPGEWFGAVGDVLYNQLSKSNQRRFRHQTLGFAEGSLKSTEQEREVFELVNYGGVPQGESDLPTQGDKT